MEDELRAVREHLFRQFEAADSPAAVLDLQLAMVEEIKLAEAVIKVDRDASEREHRHLIRLLGDALAWRLLHPYAIRHLYTGDSAPPSLSNQAGFENTIEMARQATEKGHPVLIADLTYCIGTGDVIGCADPERPYIMESGGELTGSSHHRKGRQMRRALAVAQLLSRGHARLPGNEKVTVTFELDDAKADTYDSVGESIRYAIVDGQALVRAGQGDVIRAAAHGDGPLRVPEGMAEIRKSLRHPIVSLFRVHERRPNPRVRPPYAWPIEPELRLAVAESDVFVVHVIDLDEFVGRSKGRARLTGYERREGAYWLIGEVEGERYPLSPAFVDEVLLGFETIDSAANAMLSLLDAVHGAEPPATDEPPPGVEGVAIVETREQAEALASDASAPETYDIVTMPLELFEELRREAEHRDGR